MYDVNYIQISNYYKDTTGYTNKYINKQRRISDFKNSYK